MPRGMVRLAVQATVAIGLGASVVAGGSWLGSMANREALKSTSLTKVRQQALALFPRGSRLKDAADHLAGIGFECQTMTHFLADISAPSLICRSNGRGYPDFPAVNLTVMTRNGLIADIDVWNVMARADDDAAFDAVSTGSIPARVARAGGRPLLAP